MQEMNYEYYLELCQQIRWHNYLYFEKQTPVIEDSAYDALVERLRRIEQLHPEWVGEQSPTQQVGERTTQGFQSVPHKRPMLSLDKVFTLEQIERFDRRIRSEVEHPRYCVEYKMDGCALSIWYERGRFVRALTRGDGRYGDDVTANVRAMGQLPEKLEGPEFLELRAELYMSYEAFEKCNAWRQDEGLAPFANPRNAAAGSLKLLNPQEVAARGLSLAIYSAQGEGISSLEESWHLIDQQKLPAIDCHLTTESLQEIYRFIDKTQAVRNHLPYAIDGVVIKLSDYAQAARLGATGQYYRWGVAYKFSPESASTQLLEIQLQVGRTGVVTPVAQLAPVLLDGSLISRCSLYNSDEIERKGIRIGDWVEIVKGGDIIPKVVGVDLSRRSEGLQPWKMPRQCPVCGADLMKESDEVAWRCSNEYRCRAQIVRRLIYFVSKDAFDVEGLGERTIEQLVERALVQSPEELFTLKMDDLLEIEGFGPLSAQKLLNSLNARRQIPLERLLVGLSIKHLGVGMAQALAKRFGSIEALRQGSYEQFLQVEGVGPKAAESIAQALAPDHPIAQTLDRLLAVGVRPIVKEVASTLHSFSNKLFVLTGSLTRYTRSEAARLIRERGGEVAAAVTGRTDYLISGRDPGSKLDKAIALGVKLLGEEEFERLL